MWHALQAETSGTKPKRNRKRRKPEAPTAPGTADAEKPPSSFQRARREPGGSSSSGGSSCDAAAAAPSTTPAAARQPAAARAAPGQKKKKAAARKRAPARSSPADSCDSAAVVLRQEFKYALGQATPGAIDTPPATDDATGRLTAAPLLPAPGCQPGSCPPAAQRLSSFARHAASTAAQGGAPLQVHQLLPGAVPTEIAQLGVDEHLPQQHARSSGQLDLHWQTGSILQMQRQLVQRLAGECTLMCAATGKHGRHCCPGALSHPACNCWHALRHALRHAHAPTALHGPRGAPLPRPPAGLPAPTAADSLSWQGAQF